MDRNIIYFDNAASTPIDPRVPDRMRQVENSIYANASSLHMAGREAAEVLEDSRGIIAKTLNIAPEEVIFTSGGTESNNFAVKGAVFALRGRGRHIIVSSIEHDSVLESARWLEGFGYEVSLLPVDEFGLADPDALEGLIRPDTLLVSVMHANNEIGTVQPIKKLAQVCHSRGVLFHTDACQSYGKIPLDMKDAGADIVTINAHKIHGPKGVGALAVRHGTPLQPLLNGGGHEGGLRSGTENVPGIAGFALAAQLAAEEMSREGMRLTKIRDKIIKEAGKLYPGAYLNGHPTKRLPGNISLSFSGLEGEAIKLLILLEEEGVAVSTGSACSSHGTGNGSHVLAAIGRDPFRARGALRISLGRFNTEDEAEIFLDSLGECLKKLSPISSLF